MDSNWLHWALRELNKLRFINLIKITGLINIILQIIYFLTLPFFRNGCFLKAFLPRQTNDTDWVFFQCRVEHSIHIFLWLWLLWYEIPWIYKVGFFPHTHFSNKIFFGWFWTKKMWAKIKNIGQNILVQNLPNYIISSHE